MRLLLVVAFVAVSTAGAAGSSDLTGQVWVLSTLSGKGPVPGTSPTMEFASGKVSGSTGCNSYSGGYKSRLRTLRIEQPIATTMKACSPAISTQEKSFLAMLGKIRRYAVRGDTLTLKGAVGNQLARLKAETQELAGTSWRVTAYNNGKQAVTSVASGTKLTAAFSKPTVSGSGGCNTYDAPYTATPPKISFGPIAATRKNCPTPRAVMTQETAYFTALGTVRTYKVEGATLELRTGSGALAVELTRAG
jgi:heat shock protein HslJ